MAGYVNPFDYFKYMEARNPINVGEGDMVGKPAVVPSSGQAQNPINVGEGDMVGKPAVVPSSGQAKTPEQVTAFENEATADARANRAVNESYADYVKALADYTTPPISPEDQQRRERAAYSRAGIGAFGNVLNAFSNLIFTGQGAPSQTLPGNPDPHSAIKDSQALNNERARQYVANQGARLNAAMQMQSARDARKATAQKMQNDMMKMQLEIQKAERDGRLADAKYLTEQVKAQKAQYDALMSKYKVDNAPEEFELKKRKEESAIQANKARATSSYASAEASRARATKTAQDGSLEVDLGDGTFARIPKSRANAANLGKIVHALGGDGMIETNGPIDVLTGEPTTVKKPMDANQMWAWIGHQIGTVGITEDAAEQLRNLSGDAPTSVDGSPLAKKSKEKKKVDF